MGKRKGFVWKRHGWIVVCTLCGATLMTLGANAGRGHDEPWIRYGPEAEAEGVPAAVSSAPVPGVPEKAPVDEALPLAAERDPAVAD